MKSKLKVLMVAVALACAPVVFNGCATSPVGKATQVVSTTAQTVDIAMRAWADYAVAEEIRISKLPPADRLAPKSDLLRKEGRVATAHGEYRKALRSSAEALKAARDGAPLPAAVSNLGYNLLQIIKESKQ